MLLIRFITNNNERFFIPLRYIQKDKPPAIGYTKPKVSDKGGIYHNKRFFKTTKENDKKKNTQ